MKVTPRTKVKWLKLKEKTIGGSEVSASLGMNPYFSPRDLWLIKTKRMPPKLPTIQMTRGNLMENVLFGLWHDENKECILVKGSDKNTLYFHDEYNFISCTPDRRIVMPDQSIATIEIKSTFGRYEEPLDMWIIQLQYEMMLTGDQTGIIIWEYPDPRICFKYQIYFADQNLQKQLTEHVVEWWNAHIVNDIEPEPTCESDILNMFPDSAPDKIIDLTDELALKYGHMVELKNEISEKTKELDQQKEQVKIFMRDAEKAKYLGNTLFSWKTNSAGTRVFKIF
jgi:predicted phage-related endonuclease